MHEVSTFTRGMTCTKHQRSQRTFVITVALVVGTIIQPSAKAAFATTQASHAPQAPQAPHPSHAAHAAHAPSPTHALHHLSIKQR